MDDCIVTTVTRIEGQVSGAVAAVAAAVSEDKNIKAPYGGFYIFISEV